MAGQKNELTPEQKAAQEAEELARQEAEEKARLEADQRAQANAKETVVVTFVKPYSRYSRGDVAGFAAAEAERLVKGRVAVKGSKLPAKKPEQDSEPKA
jgi:hypothetical protein